MITLEIEYPFLFFNRKVKGYSPTSWDELTEKQLVEIARNVNGREIDFHFLSALTSISVRFLKLLSPFQLLKLSREINFIANAVDYHNKFIIRRLKGTKLYSPKPKLTGMTFGQFIFADTYYNNWMIDKDTQTLNKFIASLYLYHGEKFNDETLTSKTKIIEKTQMADRLSVAYNYSLIISWLQKSYPLVFVGEKKQNEDIAISQPTEKQPARQVASWLKLFDTLVGDDLINRDRYAKLPIHTVLTYLTTKYKENARKG